MSFSVLKFDPALGLTAEGGSLTEWVELLSLLQVYDKLLEVPLFSTHVALLIHYPYRLPQTGCAKLAGQRFSQLSTRLLLRICLHGET